MISNSVLSIGWVEIGAFGTLGILLLGLYRYKSDNLESAREREEYLRNLEGKSLQQGKYRITIDNIELEESSGSLYQLKRWSLRPLDGTLYITLRLHEIGIPDELWEIDHVDVFYDVYDFDVKCVKSQIHPKHTALVFQVGSTEYEDAKIFLDMLLKFFYTLEEAGEISVQNTGPGGLPF